MYKELYDKLQAFSAKLQSCRTAVDLEETQNDFYLIMQDVERLWTNEQRQMVSDEAVAKRWHDFCDNVQANKKLQPEYFI